MLATLLRQSNKTAPLSALGGPVSPQEATDLIRRGMAPAGMRVSGHLSLVGDAKITALPADLHVTRLTVAGCGRLTTLPPGLRCYELDTKETPPTALPPTLAKTPLRWRGVPIDTRIAFHPKTITAAEVLDTPNAELRRVLLERMGYEAFLAAAQAQVLDWDTDPGGERRLLRVPLSGDEALVCVAVSCPSTGRQYIIRVPPNTRTCHQASAWIAGFDNPDDYRPIAET